MRLTELRNLLEIELGIPIYFPLEITEISSNIYGILTKTESFISKDVLNVSYNLTIHLYTLPDNFTFFEAIEELEILISLVLINKTKAYDIKFNTFYNENENNNNILLSCDFTLILSENNEIVNVGQRQFEVNQDIVLRRNNFKNKLGI
jgi:hypothetical protein